MSFSSVPSSPLLDNQHSNRQVGLFSCRHVMFCRQLLSADSGSASQLYIMMKQRPRGIGSPNHEGSLHREAPVSRQQSQAQHSIPIAIQYPIDGGFLLALLLMEEAKDVLDDHKPGWPLGLMKEHHQVVFLFLIFIVFFFLRNITKSMKGWASGWSNGL